MIKSIRFENFRNLKGEYDFNQQFQVIFGKNNTGKTNILDGIRLAFSAISFDYYRIKKSDFVDSDDSKVIKIYVELEPDAIPTLVYFDNGIKKCGFTVTVSQSNSGRYKRTVSLLNGSQVDHEILREDPYLPEICSIPLIRTEEIYSDGFSTGLSKFIESEDVYKDLKKDSMKQLKEEMKDRIEKFQNFCQMFGQKVDINFSEPRVSDEKAYVVDGDKEHNFNIGSGYRSIANIILNTIGKSSCIILIDEIENHLHPQMIRTLIREIKKLANVTVIATTHSPVVVNEVKIAELISAKGEQLSEIDPKTTEKLDTFLHPGRAELLFADNIILVEGYTEELLLKHYLSDTNRNWTVVNVAGVMFEPYIILASFLGKKVITISDNDCSLDEGGNPSSRFAKLQNLCNEKKIKLIEMINTLESDLYINGFLNGKEGYLKPAEKNDNILIAKTHMKIVIAQELIQEKCNLSSWHVIKEIENEFASD